MALPACGEVPLSQRQDLPTAFLRQCAVRCQQARLVIVHQLDGQLVPTVWTVQQARLDPHQQRVQCFV
jgi:hypothetical protein